MKPPTPAERAGKAICDTIDARLKHMHLSDQLDAMSLAALHLDLLAIRLRVRQRDQDGMLGVLAATTSVPEGKLRDFSRDETAGLEHEELDRLRHQFTA